MRSPWKLGHGSSARSTASRPNGRCTSPERKQTSEEAIADRYAMLSAAQGGRATDGFAVCGADRAASHLVACALLVGRSRVPGTERCIQGADGKGTAVRLARSLLVFGDSMGLVGQESVR